MQKVPYRRLGSTQIASLSRFNSSSWQIKSKESEKSLKDNIAGFLNQKLRNPKGTNQSRNTSNTEKRFKSCSTNKSKFNKPLYQQPDLVDIAKKRCKFKRSSIEKKVEPKCNQREVKAVLRNVLSSGMQPGNFVTLNYENLIRGNNEEEDRKIKRIEKSAWCCIK